ncbi:MAG: TetR/AcrR family transcriptional regulator C-terminal domain-containing protein, partial [Pseudomonadota bacterium]
GIASFITDAVAAGELVVDDATLAANDLWSLILSGPRDHFLHHVNETPDPVDLLDSIGHGLRVFLTVYSTHRDRDLEELQAKLDEAQARRLTGPNQKR